jgi:hypothetical protein
VWPWRLGNEVGWAIVWELRVARATLGLLIGGALGLSGAVLQRWLRNPLAEPGVIGVSAGASFAAVCAFYSGLAAAFTLALPLAGIAGSAIAVALLTTAVRAGTGTVSLLLMAAAGPHARHRGRDPAGRRTGGQPRPGLCAGHHVGAARRGCAWHLRGGEPARPQARPAAAHRGVAQPVAWSRRS